MLKPKIAFAVLCGLALLLIALIVLAAGVGATRTVVISAHTSSAQIQFSGDASYWDLGDVIICTPLDRPNRAAKRGSSLCDPRRYVQTKQSVSLIWQDGNKAALFKTNDDLEIEIIRASSHKAGTRFHISNDALAKRGTFSFSGFVSLGQVAASGETRLLHSGLYDIREKPFLTDATETIKNGEFRSGEKVGIYQTADGAPKQTLVYGYLLPNLDDPRSFKVSLVAEPGPSKIRVSFFGGQDAIEIAPNWIDRSIASPLILALSIFLPIIFAIAQLVLNASSELRFVRFFAAIKLLRSVISRQRFRS